MLSELWNAIPLAIAVLDDEGRVLAVNRAWRELDAGSGHASPETGDKDNYQDICDRIIGQESAQVQTAVAGIQQVLSGAAPDFELEYPRRSPRRQNWFHLRAARHRQDRRNLTLLTHRDVTERKLLERQRELSIELLRRINGSASARELAAEIVPLLRDWADCQAVGLRLGMDGDFPYLAASGFSPEFLESEKHLCAGGCSHDGRPNLACVCGCVIRGDMDRGILTDHGSFWCQDAPELAAERPDLKDWTRGTCLTEGYRSLALVPLRLGREQLGLIQLNDRRPGRFTAEQIAFLERLAGNLAVAFAEFRSRDHLRQSEEKYRLLTESVRDVAWILDVETLRYLYVSPTAKLQRGFTAEEIMALPLQAALMPGMADQLIERIRRGVQDYLAGRVPLGTPYVQEVEQPCKDGSTVWTEVVASLYRNEKTGRLEIHGVSRDIGERRRAEAEIARHRAAVAHLDRLNIMGQMVSGLAHELNQPLTAIRNYAHYCRTVSQTGDASALSLPDALVKIDQAAARAGQIIDRLRAFVRKQEPTRTMVDVNQIVRSSVDLMEPFLQRGRIRVELQVAAETLDAELDRVQIEQVVVNLLQNAIDAMVQTPLPARVIGLRSWADGGGAVHVEVADRGEGIASEDQPRVFEEFYTTKPHGTGLGLSISRNIMEGHGGRLVYRPRSGGGAVFEMVLPRRKGAHAL
jgi:PAS domain S-box-containing protein